MAMAEGSSEPGVGGGGVGLQMSTTCCTTLHRFQLKWFTRNSAEHSSEQRETVQGLRPGSESRWTGGFHTWARFHPKTCSDHLGQDLASAAFSCRARRTFLNVCL